MPLKLWASFRSHQLIQTGVTVRKCPIRVTNRQFCIPYYLEMLQVTSKNNKAHLLRYFKFCASFHNHQWILNSSSSPETPNLCQNRRFMVLCGLKIWWMTLKNNRARLLCYFKLCASCHNHRLIQTRVKVHKHQIWVKIGDFFVPCVLEVWRMISKNNRTHFLCYFKLLHL